jgi:hypothetical protein
MTVSMAMRLALALPLRAAAGMGAPAFAGLNGRWKCVTACPCMSRTREGARPDVCGLGGECEYEDWGGLGSYSCWY